MEIRTYCKKTILIKKVQRICFENDRKILIIFFTWGKRFIHIIHQLCGFNNHVHALRAYDVLFVLRTGFSMRNSRDAAADWHTGCIDPLPILVETNHLERP